MISTRFSLCTIETLPSKLEVKSSFLWCSTVKSPQPFMAPIGIDPFSLIYFPLQTYYLSLFGSSKALSVGYLLCLSLSSFILFYLIPARDTDDVSFDEDWLTYSKRLGFLCHSLEPGLLIAGALVYKMEFCVQGRVATTEDFQEKPGLFLHLVEGSFTKKET